MWKRPFSGSDLADLDAGSAGDLTAFVGASTGLLSDDDVALAAGQIEPGTSALLIVYENRWAGAFVAAVRRNGGELIAFERIHTSDLVAALDAAEAVLPGASRRLLRSPQRLRLRRQTASPSSSSWAS